MESIILQEVTSDKWDALQCLVFGFTRKCDLKSRAAFQPESTPYHPVGDSCQPAYWPPVDFGCNGLPVRWHCKEQLAVLPAGLLQVYAQTQLVIFRPVPFEAPHFNCALSHVKRRRQEIGLFRDEFEQQQRGLVGKLPQDRKVAAHEAEVTPVPEVVGVDGLVRPEPQVCQVNSRPGNAVGPVDGTHHAPTPPLPPHVQREQAWSLVLKQ